MQINLVSVTPRIPAGGEIRGVAYVDGYSAIRWDISGIGVVGTSTNLRYRIADPGTYTVQFAACDGETGAWVSAVPQTVVVSPRGATAGTAYAPEMYEEHAIGEKSLYLAFAAASGNHLRGRYRANHLAWIDMDDLAPLYSIQDGKWAGTLYLISTGVIEIEIDEYDAQTSQKISTSTYLFAVYDPSITPRGAGTQDDPYIISNRSELMYLKTRGDKLAWFALANDIEVGGWYAIGTFRGHIDGRGHTLYNVGFMPYYLDAEKSVCYAFASQFDGGDIQNIGISAAKLVITDSPMIGDIHNITVAGIGGDATGAARVSACWIDMGDITITVSSSTKTVSVNFGGVWARHGVAALGNRATISDVFCTGAVAVTDLTPKRTTKIVVGGIIGQKTCMAGVSGDDGYGGVTASDRVFAVARAICDVDITIVEGTAKQCTGILGQIAGSSIYGHVDPTEHVQIIDTVYRAGTRTRCDGVYRIASYDDVVAKSIEEQRGGVFEIANNLGYDAVSGSGVPRARYGCNGDDASRAALATQATYEKIEYDFASVWKMAASSAECVFPATPMLQGRVDSPRLISATYPRDIVIHTSALVSSDWTNCDTAAWYDGDTKIIDGASGSAQFDTAGIHALDIRAYHGTETTTVPGADITVHNFTISTPHQAVLYDTIPCTAAYIGDLKVRDYAWYASRDDGAFALIGTDEKISYIVKNKGNYAIYCRITLVNPQNPNKVACSIASAISTCYCGDLAIIAPDPKRVYLIGTPVQFECTPVPELILWEFGDGSIGDGTKTYHTYTMPGNYTVRALGETTNVVSSCRVDDDLHVQIDRKPQIVFTNLKMDFHATANVTPSQIVWDFGDGSPKRTGPHVEHQFWPPEKLELPEVTIRVDCTYTHDDGRIYTASDEYMATRADLFSSYTNSAGDVAEFGGNSCVMLRDGKIGFGDIQLQPQYAQGGSAYRGMIYHGTAYGPRTFSFRFRILGADKSEINVRKSRILHGCRTDGIGTFTFVRDDGGIFTIECTPAPGYPKFDVSAENGLIGQMAFFAPDGLWQGPEQTIDSPGESTPIDNPGDVPCGFSADISHGPLENHTTGKGIYARDGVSIDGCHVCTDWRHAEISYDGQLVWDRISIASTRVTLEPGINIITGASTLRFRPLYLGV